tara:strand:+ start:415 stop:1746 length:1332 start_codon:yes stop_codon:yes gene_type:complete
MESHQSKKILNFLIFLFPLSFTIGSAAINIDILLISILGFFIYKKEIFQIKKDYISIIIIIFFMFLVLSTIVNYYNNLSHPNVIKSFIYLRYLLFALILRCMVEKNDLNLKYLLFSCLAFVILISLDINYQYFIGENLLGFETSQWHNSGIFNKELIAGGYIQRFACLGIFFLPIFFADKKKELLLYLTGILVFIFVSLIFAGNRMPVFIFLLFIFLGILFVKETRNSFILASILSIVSFVIILNNDHKMRAYFSSLYDNALTIFPIIIKEQKANYENVKSKEGERFVNEYLEGKKDFSDWNAFGSGHATIFSTAIDTFRDRPLFGGGIKSFRVNCKSKLNLPNRTCESHTHNYYLEILNDTGLVGLLLIIFPVFYLLIKRYKKLSKNDFILTAIILCLILEFFPFRSSGNFFSTLNSSYLFFLIGLLLGYKKISKLNFYNIF